MNEQHIVAIDKWLERLNVGAGPVESLGYDIQGDYVRIYDDRAAAILRADIWAQLALVIDSIEDFWGTETIQDAPEDYDVDD